MRTRSLVLFALLAALPSQMPVAHAQAAGLQPDADTVLFLHLDGELVDASDNGHRLEVRGSAAWAAGRLGQALRLDGATGVGGGGGRPRPPRP
ncbi:MAG: hypothetical protein ACE5JM_10205, partial [Armatimonadota bacterium]